MFPVILKVGPLTIYSYGTMMAIAFLVAGFLTAKELQRKNLDPDVASTLVVWAAIGGVAFSKLWSVAEDVPGLLRDPVHAIFSGSGFVWYGGLLGGTLAISWVVRRHKLPWLQVVDSAAPGLALGHAIGRIGCQLAGDGDWGAISEVPWAMAYPDAIIGWPFPPGVRVHPTPVYETLAYVAVFAILWSIRKRPLPPGTIFWWYLVLGPGARFLIEFVRINRPVVFSLTAPQLVSLALVAIGAWQLWQGRHQPVRAAPVARKS